MTKKTIGVIGGGFVGGAIGNHYKKAGRDVKIYDKFKPVDSLEEVLKRDFLFVAVPTPSDENGINLEAIQDALQNASKADDGKIVIIKSTVIPGTTEKLQKQYPKLRLIFNPEFLTELTAEQDFNYPDRQIVGYTKESHSIAGDVMSLLPLAPFCRMMPATEAEMVKYYGNNWFAVKVVFANQMYDVCQKMGIDYEMIAEAAAADKRIGPSHLEIWHKDYRGYGGKCLPKDIQAMIKHGDNLGLDLELFKVAEKLNQQLVSQNKKKSEESDRE